MKAPDLKNSSIDKLELLMVVLDIIEASERATPSGRFEREYAQAVELTADVLHRFAEAKRNSLDGLPAETPADILDRHMRLLRLRRKASRR